MPDRSRGDPAIRAVVLYGGERAFAAGADIKEMVDRTPGEIAAHGQASQRRGDRGGPVDPAGDRGRHRLRARRRLELALAADFRIVAENAVLGLPEITLGVIPGRGWHAAAAAADRGRPGPRS